jgi:F-type H+-transporting ATPase subunit alpha
MAEQITVLLALSAGLFDRVPLEKVADAERALRDKVPGIPAEVTERFTTAGKLSDGDRKATLEVAARALAPFQPAPEPAAGGKPAP